MLQKACFYIVLICIIFSCKDVKKKNNCRAFQTGSFFYSLRESNGMVPFRIERHDTLQVETNQRTKDIFRYKLTWTDDCSYELRYIDGTYRFTPAQWQAKKAEVRKTRITGTTALYCLFESETNNGSITNDTLWRQQ